MIADAHATSRACSALAASLLLVLGASACSDGTLTDVDTLAFAPPVMSLTVAELDPPATNSDIPAHRATVCANAPIGSTHTFETSVESGGPGTDIAEIVETAEIAGGECMAVVLTRTPASTRDIVIVAYDEHEEHTLTGVRRFFPKPVPSIDPDGPPTMDEFDGPVVDYDHFNLWHPVLFIFDLEPAEMGLHGCSPGFWRNRAMQIDAWAEAGFDPDQTIASVFDDVSPRFDDLGDHSLHEGLQFGGGPGELGGARILLRAAVAALLNASHGDVDYPRTADDVFDDVNEALRDGTRADMLQLADALDEDNNLGCPI